MRAQTLLNCRLFWPGARRPHQANLFQPDALVLALGFDIYRADPQAKVAVTTEGFARLGRDIAGLDLPTLVVQEGGYDLDSLSDNLQAFLTPLLQR